MTVGQWFLRPAWIIGSLHGFSSNLRNTPSLSLLCGNGRRTVAFFGPNLGRLNLLGYLCVIKGEVWNKAICDYFKAIMDEVVARGGGRFFFLIFSLEKKSTKYPAGLDWLALDCECVIFAWLS